MMLCGAVHVSLNLFSIQYPNCPVSDHTKLFQVIEQFEEIGKVDSG